MHFAAQSVMDPRKIAVITMKFTTIITAAALLLTSTVLANPVPNAEAGANPQICYCNLGCYDSCGQKFCC
ncbi:hypothetical protein VE03_00058 [Pseudogymnoascus sp. 23342-1-I1]|nr:hypothetical protein VE03_00058 [Pseudogymnoascus sp. 23342-1-I1]